MDEKEMLNKILFQLLELKSEIKELRQELNSKLEEVKEELRQEFNSKLEEVKEELRQEFNSKLEEVKEELRQEFNSKLEEIKEEFDSKLQGLKMEMSKDAAEHTHNVLDAIRTSRDGKIAAEIKKHEDKTIKGVEAFRNILVS